MKPDFKAIQEDKEISLLIEKGNEVLKALGYTEHSRRHAAKVSQTAERSWKSWDIKINRSNWPESQVICTT